MRTVISSLNGQKVPVTIDLNVKPLVVMGKVVRNGRGEVVMDDQWIYYNGIAINVNRANYCQKIYASQINILDTIGKKKITPELKEFIEKVSDKIVFEKYGQWFRIYLRNKTSRTMDIYKVVPYNWTIAPNLRIDNKFFASQCCIDWRSRFYINKY